MSGGRLPDVGAPPALAGLEDAIRRIAREAAQEAVRAALQDAPGSQPKFTTLARHARTAGVSQATLRRWARAAGVFRQANGRYLGTDLDRAVQLGGKRPAEPPASPVHDLAAARARRAAAELLGKGGAR